MTHAFSVVSIRTLSRESSLSEQSWDCEGQTLAESTPKVGHASRLKRTVRLKRPPNRDLRTREYLTEVEVERLIAAAKHNRHGLPGRTAVACHAEDAGTLWAPYEVDG